MKSVMFLFHYKRGIYFSSFCCSINFTSRILFTGTIGSAIEDALSDEITKRKDNIN